MKIILFLRLGLFNCKRVIRCIMKREMIGKRLKDIRIKLDLTRKEVSETVDIGTTTLQQWENGTREASIETIEKLAKLYNTTAQYIIFGDTSDQTTIF